MLACLWFPGFVPYGLMREHFARKVTRGFCARRAARCERILTAASLCLDRATTHLRLGHPDLASLHRDDTFAPLLALEPAIRLLRSFARAPLLCGRLRDSRACFLSAVSFAAKHLEWFRLRLSRLVAVTILVLFQSVHEHISSLFIHSTPSLNFACFLFFGLFQITTRTREAEKKT